MGIEDSFREKLNEEEKAVFDSNICPTKMIYVSAFQAGAQEFVLDRSVYLHEKGNIEKFINEKYIPSTKKTAGLHKNINSLFPRASVNAMKSAIVEAFIRDLIIGMENDSSIINVTGIPTLSKIKESLPPDVAIPIIAMCSDLKPMDVLCPTPTLKIDRESANRYREIIESNLYHQYSNFHCELESASSDKYKILVEIERSGNKLIKKASGALFPRLVSMNILQVAPKIIDAAFGNLPGSLAQSFGDIATKFMQKEKDIVIYQFQEWSLNYAKEIMLHCLSNKTEDLQIQEWSLNYAKKIMLHSLSNETEDLQKAVSIRHVER
jgi:hypothetical protein